MKRRNDAAMDERLARDLAGGDEAKAFLIRRVPLFKVACDGIPADSKWGRTGHCELREPKEKK